MAGKVEVYFGMGKSGTTYVTPRRCPAVKSPLEAPNCMQLTTSATLSSCPYLIGVRVSHVTHTIQMLSLEAWRSLMTYHPPSTAMLHALCLRQTSDGLAIGAREEVWTE